MSRPTQCVHIGAGEGDGASPSTPRRPWPCRTGRRRAPPPEPPRGSGLVAGLSLSLGICGGSWAGTHRLWTTIEQQIEALAVLRVDIEEARATLARIEETTWGLELTNSSRGGTSCPHGRKTTCRGSSICSWNRAHNCHPAVQSRNDDRKPWATAAISWYRSIFGSVDDEIGRAHPLRIGNTKPQPSPSARAASRISIARRQSGTRCSRFAFIRRAGRSRRGRSRPSRLTSRA